MSVVIACKFNNGTIVASDRQVTMYMNKVENSVSKTMKIDNKNIIVGGVGLLRDLQNMFNISNSLFEDVMNQLNEKELIRIVHNKLTNIFKEHQYIESNQILRMASSFLMVDPYNINLLCGDLSILSNFDYFAIGCGDDLVMGHLNIEFKNKNPKDMDQKDIIKILKESIKVACKDSIGIDDNIDIKICYKHAKDLITDSMFEIIERCEYDILGKDKPKSECNKKCKSCIHNLKLIYDKQQKSIQGIFS